MMMIGWMLARAVPQPRTSELRRSFRFDRACHPADEAEIEIVATGVGPLAAPQGEGCPAPGGITAPVQPAADVDGLWREVRPSGRIRLRKPLPVTDRRPRDPREQIAAFIGWLRDEDYTTWMSSDDMLEAYEAWAADNAVSQIEGSLALRLMGETGGVIAMRKRLAAPEFALLKRRLGRERAEIYRVMAEDEIAAAARAALDGPAVPADLRCGEARVTVSAASRRQSRKPKPQADLFADDVSAPAAKPRRRAA